MENRPRFLNRFLLASLVSGAVLMLTPPALGAPPSKPKAAKAKPCPKGTYAATSTITGKRGCFSLTIRPAGSLPPVPAPAKKP